MKTYLYRAIATEAREPEDEWDIGIEPGEVLGRMSGYLSRSSAKEAGECSGVAYKVIRSEPVVFREGWGSTPEPALPREGSPSGSVTITIATPDPAALAERVLAQVQLK